ncbi:B12-binding domain-containing radical SAM protein [Streptomyces rhizosphaericus]|uniref:B12-binding domain-containing radical SAM protein n=1 Tax=Streptomyces rhizosphaericus TaxID=114699 RepID=A0A6G4AEE9_9ACTN|nr:radical SAM protein [Streptomyces rhizosphaericus]NEW71051.1 B12-binding domain-containing radical SAM protein [Streptomyces rhizosphaericus]
MRQPPSTTNDSSPDLIAGADPARALDALFINAPLRDYSLRPRTNDYTLPVIGMAYIATYARERGFNVGILDAEAHGLGVQQTIDAINAARPRWAGMNLLAPTYELSARIAAGLDPDIALMVGGHHAKAMPTRILADPRMGRLRALIIGEAETRVAALLDDTNRRTRLPGVMWRDRLLGTNAVGVSKPEDSEAWLTPDINARPFVNRAYLPQDPYRTSAGRWKANMVGARGCPYECTFCGAAASVNPDVKIRTRAPDNIIAEMDELHGRHQVTAFRFIDDLFLGAHRIIADMMRAFTHHRVGERYVWDATGRINVLARESSTALDTLMANGLTEVALGIESGSDRVLALMDKRITAEMTLTVARRLMERGINVKGYFLLGFPGEQPEDLAATVRLIHDLWELEDRLPGSGSFRASAFEFRPYPGTAAWAQLIAAGHSPEELLNYSDVDLTEHGANESMRARDEFNFSVGLPFSGTDLPELRRTLSAITREQHTRTSQGVSA